MLRLTCETLKYRPYLEKILNCQNVMRHFASKRLSEDRVFCLVLLYELIFGIGKIRLMDKEIQRILKDSRKDILFEHEQLKSDGILPESLVMKTIALPRYARINTLKSSVNEILTLLEQGGFNLLDNSDITSQKKFNAAIQGLDKKAFFFDINVENLLVFHPSADLHDLDCVKNKELILQDKVSLLFGLNHLFLG